MSLPPDFRQTLAEKSNKELVEMLVQYDDYLPEALVAAKDELRIRNISPEELQKARALVVLDEIRAAREKSGSSTGVRVLAHLGWCFFIAGLVGVVTFLRGCLSHLDP